MKTNLVAWFKQGYGWFFFAWLLFDYGTKIWAATTNVNITIIPNFFYLAYSRNTGAAWSLFSGQLPLLALISFTVGVGFGYVYLKKYATFDRYHHISLTLFLSGTWGNFIDRAFYEEGVIDFLSFHFGSYIFPTFNIADTGLTLGVIGLIVLSIFEKKKASTHA
jgi:signal peptidase II